jgi:hypothetical protein
MLVTGCLFLIAPPFSLAVAQSAQDEDTGPVEEMTDESRYQLNREGDSFVRLDRKTGAMSVCKLKGENLVCRMAADDRDALQDEIGDLQDRIARLENKDRSGRKSEGEDEDSGYPLDEEFEQAMEYSSKVIRRFFDVMKELRDDLNQ